MKAFLLFVSLCFISCASQPLSSKNATDTTDHTPVYEATDPKGNRAETASFQLIERSFLVDEFKKAVFQASDYVKKFPKSSLLSKVYNLRALSYMKLSQENLAIQDLNTALRIEKSQEFKQSLLYNLAVAYFEGKKTDLSEQTLRKIKPELLSIPQRKKFYFLNSKIFSDRGLVLDASRELLKASQASPSGRELQVLRSRLLILLEKISQPEGIQSLIQEFPKSSLRDALYFGLAKKEREQGSYTVSENHFRMFMNEFPYSDLRAEAANYLEQKIQVEAANPSVIGVLLPMTGKFAPYGEQTLHGIQLALQYYDFAAPDHQIEIVIQDSGSTEEETRKAFDELVTRHDPMVVIGPLRSLGIKEISERAGNLGIPLLSLSQSPGEKNPFVISSGLTPEIQTEELARHAIEDLGYKRFAILYPEDTFGKSYSEAFWNAVEKHGGTIQSIESYPSGSSDVREAVRGLLGLRYVDARKEELRELAALRQKDGITRRTRKTEKYYALPPLMNFDAVFIPDEPKALVQILPTFSYFDADRVRFLGPNSWNSPDLARRMGRSGENAQFVDAFFRNSERPVQKSFFQEFTRTYGREPGRLEALSFDATRVVRQILLRDQPKSRNDFLDSIRQLRNFPGVTGTIDYNDGTLHRKLYILTFSKGATQEILEN